MTARIASCPVCGERMRLQGLDGHCRNVHRVRKDGTPYVPTPGEVRFGQQLAEAHAVHVKKTRIERIVDDVLRANVSIEDLRAALRPVLGVSPAAPPVRVTVDPTAEEVGMPAHEVVQWGRTTGLQYWGRTR